MEGPLITGENSPTEAEIEKLKEEKSERRAAPEASELHGSGKAHEHIGQVLLTAELKEKQIATLNPAELLALSEKIMVDGTSLRQIYETHLIGEPGLRRLVAEYLGGGDVKRSLRQEIVEHEIDFERDPALRGMAATAIDALSETAPASSKANFENMVEEASKDLGDNPQASYYKSRTSAEVQDRRPPQKSRSLLDIGLISIITVLILAIIILLLTRR